MSNHDIFKAPDVLKAQARDEKIKLHGPADFEGMRKAGILAAATLDMLVPHVVPGVTTQKIDDLILQFALDHKAIPATLNYRGYTHSTCTSINHVVCHGIPGPKVLREGDIVNIDVTLIVDGWHGDTSRMYGVGTIKPRAARLIEVTYESLARGIAAVKPGATTGDIGLAIETYARAQRCSVVEDFCGHGLGRLFHDRPNILHYRHSTDGKDAGPGIRLEPGMFFTIEPMINLGKAAVKVLGDGWTAVTRDRELTAQCEHTIGVTKDGCEIFTLSPAGHFMPPFQVH